MADAFLKKGCKIYIGTPDYVEGNSSLFFVIRFFYELINSDKDYIEAFQLASSTDQETRLFKLYNR